MYEPKAGAIPGSPLAKARSAYYREIVIHQLTELRSYLQTNALDVSVLYHYLRLLVAALHNLEMLAPPVSKDYRKESRKTSKAQQVAISVYRLTAVTESPDFDPSEAVEQAKLLVTELELEYPPHPLVGADNA